jgi:vancomycin resistance protein YoaR
MSSTGTTRLRAVPADQVGATVAKSPAGTVDGVTAHGLTFGRRRRPWGRTLTKVAIGTVVVLLVVVIAGWAIDARIHNGRPARGVVLDERSVAGESGADLDATVADLAASWAAVPVQVTTPNGTANATLADLGVTVDRNATERAARDVGADDFVLARPFLWLRSFFAPRPISVDFAVDEAKGRDALGDLVTANHVDPTEPVLTPTTETVKMTPGAPGADVDGTAIVRQAADAARAGQRTIAIDAKAAPVAPTVSDAVASRLADQAAAMAQKSVTIFLGDKSIRVDGRTLRSWLKLAPAADGSLDVQIDETKVTQDVPKILGSLGTPPVDTGFTVGYDGRVSITPGRAGIKCCTSESVQAIATALKTGEPRVDLALTSVTPTHDVAWAQSLGITQKIGEFTTMHPGGAPRVINIHRMADTVRGAIIAPGDTFSLNGFVGQRTIEKGYVKAPVIYNAVEDEDIGGGVSQFATTTFNAAFFGGLDIPEYQMHSEYISRYPYGREATVSWDKPDLKIKNQTPYGVLIWTSYTDTSLTVTLYSTPWVRGDQTNQTKTPKGQCTAVSTERTRTYVDGHADKDTFHGAYQSADGVKC